MAKIESHSLAYDYSESGNALVLALYLPVYVTASVLPFFISSMEKAKLMGVVLVGALVATFIIKRETLTSTWCFFAAILSGIIVVEPRGGTTRPRARRAATAAPGNA